MTNPPRKYFSEFAVSLFTSAWVLTTANELSSPGEINSKHKEIVDQCHIYIISKSPSLYIKSNTFSYIDEIVSLMVEYRVTGIARQIPFRFKLILEPSEVSVVVSPYPHRELSTIDMQGEVVRRFPARFLVMKNDKHISIPELNNLEVLYVGQAFGDGSRSSFERLKSHSTLQEILANVQYHNPDDEVLLLTFIYMPYSVVTFMDPNAGAKYTGDKDLSHFLSIIDNPLNDHQQICLAEAGLIRYFKPKYNEIYKEKFPDPTHEILSSCYSLDFIALIVEIDTEDLGFNLFSSSASASYHHIAKYDLIDDKERRSFFSVTNKDGTVTDLGDNIIKPL